MTVAVGIRVPKKGCILLTDSQVTGSDGRIWTKSARKIVQFEYVSIAVSGNLAIIDHFKRAEIQFYQDVRNFFTNCSVDYEFGILCYDKVNDRLWASDHSGSETKHKYWASEGSGSQYSAGVLSVADPVTTLDQALTLAKKAAKAACELHVACGGPLQWVKCEVTK
jgi:20S proteasome alpha/beta subunit